MTRLVSLIAGGTRESWESLGLSFSGNSCALSDVQLLLQPGEPGLQSWTFSGGTPGTFSVDGIETFVVSEPPHVPSVSVIGTQKIVGLDHVVITTDNLDRTCGAIESVLQLPTKRERDAGNGVTQRFHKLENTIIEVVTGPHVTHSGSRLWGFVVSIDDLFEWAQSVGENITSAPKKAVQPGRYISTLRGSVGLGIPLAFMTPHV